MADSIELVARGNLFDALIVLVGCDKTIPARRHGACAPRHPRASSSTAARSLPDASKNRDVTIQDVFEAVGARDAADDVGGRFRRSRTPCVPGRRRLRRSVHREHDGHRLRDARHFAVRQRERAGHRRRQAGRGGSRGGPGHRRAPRGLRPRQIITRAALENAIAAVAATGGSTNAVLHLLAIANEAGVPLDIDDFDRISAKVPLLADLKPGGKLRRDRPASCRWHPARRAAPGRRRHRSRETPSP